MVCDSHEEVIHRLEVPGVVNSNQDRVPVLKMAHEVCLCHIRFLPVSLHSGAFTIDRYTTGFFYLISCAMTV